MTLDEGLGKAAEAIDRALTQRWDALVLQMIACDVSDEDADAILFEQQAVDGAWREATLAQLRTDLEHWAWSAR